MDLKWNFDFEIAALAFEVVLLIFYFAKRHLPTKQNRYFILAMVSGCISTFMDMLSALMDVYWRNVPMELLHLVNILYFMCIATNVLLLFIYVLSVTNQLDVVRTPLFLVYCIPYLLSVIMSLATPYTGALYYFDSVKGYLHGPAGSTNYILNAFYLVLAAVYVVVYRKRISRLHLYSLVSLFVLLCTGSVLQALFFPWVLLTNAFSCFAICIVYLSLQNPDLYIDKETGLFNRDGYIEYLKELIGSGAEYSFMAICLDNYRSVRTVFGEDKAYKALQEAISYVRKNYSDDHIFRYSDDTYVVLTPEKYDVEQAMEYGRKRLEGGFMVDGEQIKFSVVFIVMPYDMMDGDLKRTQNIFDYSLKSVADGVKGNIIVDEELILSSRRRNDIEIALEKAIERRSVQIYFMPIFSPITDKMERVEVLARIFDKKVGFIPPREFISEAEKNGSIISLGRHIFEKTCEFIKDQEPGSYGVGRISVNLSAMQLMQEGMAEEFIRISNKNDVSMESISFDIAEVIDTDKDRIAERNMKKLAEVGAEFALNGYGSGYSSLENIMKLPISMVKIDRALVLSYFEKDSQLLPDVIEMFRNQNLKIVLVGVETKDMARRLSVMGCDYLQGYFYSRTLPARDFVALMKRTGR
ncbi:MAG: GGDEF domain-containing protein [Lachnospiraceae bacterium]|nr:GGDEF domain-containing protein [Lachnospiraceae bacterium]